jgi:hypothetical protein
MSDCSKPLGTPIADAWAVYHARLIAAQASAVQIQELRVAFYAGAAAVLDALHDGLSASEDAEAEAEAESLLDDMHGEIQGFMQTAVRRHSRRHRRPYRD